MEENSPFSILQLDVSRTNVFPFLDLTLDLSEMYHYIEEDIDKAFEDEILNPSRIAAKIDKNFKNRFKDETFFRRVLGVNIPDYTAAMRLNGQADEREFYPKKFRAREYSQSGLFVKLFGIGDRILSFKQIYDDSNDKMKQELLDMGNIGNYARTHIPQNSPTFFDSRQWLTLERDSFYEEVEIDGKLHTVLFNVPLIHCYVKTIAKNYKVVYIDAIWKSLYGKMRYYQNNREYPKRLGLFMIMKILETFPSAELLVMRALEGSQRMFFDANMPLYAYNEEDVTDYTVYDIAQNENVNVKFEGLFRMESDITHYLPLPGEEIYRKELIPESIESITYQSEPGVLTKTTMIDNNMMEETIDSITRTRSTMRFNLVPTGRKANTVLEALKRLYENYTIESKCANCIDQARFVCESKCCMGKKIYCSLNCHA